MRFRSRFFRLSIVNGEIYREQFYEYLLRDLERMTRVESGGPTCEPLVLGAEGRKNGSRLRVWLEDYFLRIYFRLFQNNLLDKKKKESKTPL